MVEQITQSAIHPKPVADWATEVYRDVLYPNRHSNAQWVIERIQHEVYDMYINRALGCTVEVPEDIPVGSTLTLNYHTSGGKPSGQPGNRKARRQGRG